MSAELLVPDKDFAKARLHSISRENESDDEEVDLLDVGLPRQFIYKVFPDPSDQEILNEILTNVRLCLCSSFGVVTAKDQSISSIMAANLINSLFAALFSAANLITSSKQKQFIKLLQGEDRAAIESLLTRAYLTQENPAPLQVRWLHLMRAISNVLLDTIYRWIVKLVGHHQRCLSPDTKGSNLQPHSGEG